MTRRERLTYLGAYVGLSMAFCWPLFEHPVADGTGDWDQHLFYYASVLRNAAFGAPPFWNPWYCGGNVLWQNPQVSLISPVYLLALAMPLALAMKLNILGHYVLGCLGMHLVVRRVIGVESPAVVIYIVSLAVFSGGMALHLLAGHSNLLSMFWLPLLVYCFWRASAGQTPYLVSGAAIVAVSILNGGPHVVPLAAVLLGGIGLGALVFGRTVRPLILGVAIVTLGCVYSAPKLVPGWFFVASADFQDRRNVKHPDAMSMEMIRTALWDGSQGTHTRLNRDVQLYGWQEYGNYMGWFGAGLATLSAGWLLALRWRRDHWRETSAAFAFVVCLILTAGEFASLAPATLMQSLPFFSSFRIPSRHILLLPLVGGICMAYVARQREGTPRSAAWRWPIGVLCVVAACQLVLVNRQQFRDVFMLPQADASRLFDQPTPINIERDVPRVGAPAGVLYTNMLGSMLVGKSSLDCWEPLQLRKIARPGPVVPESAGAAALSNATFSPNHVTALVTVGAEPARLILNQNFSDGWSSNAGEVERDPESGRPSVLLSAGYSGAIEFRYLPPGLWLGLAVFVVSILLTCLAVRPEVSAWLDARARTTTRTHRRP